MPANTSSGSLWLCNLLSNFSFGYTFDHRFGHFKNQTRSIKRKGNQWPEDVDLKGEEDDAEGGDDKL